MLIGKFDIILDKHFIQFSSSPAVTNDLHILVMKV